MSLRIGLFSKFPPAESGIGIYAGKLADALSKKCKVVRISFGNSDCDYKVDLSGNIVEQIKQIVEKEKLDVFHFQHAGSTRTFDLEKRNVLVGYIKTLIINKNLAEMLSSLKIPTVSTIHDLLDNPRGLKEAVIKCVEKKIANSSDYVVVFSSIQKNIVKKYKRNVEFIYYGIDDINIGTRKGGLILSVGVINHAKGLHHLINAMRYLPDLHLKITGQIVDETYAKSLEKLVIENKLENVEIRFGWVPEKEKQELYKKAGLVVLPYIKTSRYSTSANLHDAISYRMPVVVSNAGSLGEIVRKFKCGIVITKLSGTSLASGIKKVYNNYNRYVFGVDKYGKFASWDKISEKHLKLYKKVIGLYNA